MAPHREGDCCCASASCGETPRLPNVDGGEEQHGNPACCASGSSCCASKSDAKPCCGGHDNSAHPAGGACMSDCKGKSCCATEPSREDAHGHSHGAGESDQPSSSSSSLMCVAVLRRGGSEVDVYDVKGRAVSFSIPEESSGNKKKTPPAKVGGMIPSLDLSSPEKRVCFSSHGNGNGADGFMTPCFDADGEHGEPDEGCFCGVDTPHLHAHVHDPTHCGGPGDGGAAPDDAGTPPDGKGKAGGTTNRFSDLTHLAQLTLHPTTTQGSHLRQGEPRSYGSIAAKESEEPNVKATRDNGAAHASGATSRVTMPVCMPVCESLPKACNSRQVAASLNERGINASDRVVRRRRMYKVQHDDHYDYLVHNEHTGNLHLEHPCDDCGDVDLHGKLNLVEKRSWVSGGDGFTKDPEAETKIHLHFFEMSSTPMDILDLMSDYFSTDTSRVAAVRPCCSKKKTHAHQLHHRDGRKQDVENDLEDHGHALEGGCCGGSTREAVADQDEAAAAAGRCCSSSGDAPCCLVMSCSKVASESHNAMSAPLLDESEKTSSRPGIVMSSLHVQSICSTSDIPAVSSLVTPLPGVTNVSINVATKSVFVDHDPSVTSAKDIELAINKKKFGAMLNMDGNSVNKQRAAPGGVGRSQFYVEGICCASEIPAVKSILEPLDGVINISINVPNKIVYVDHDLSVISAQGIADALTQEHFKSRIKKDAAFERALMTDSAFVKKYVESTFSVTSLRDERGVAQINRILGNYGKEQVQHYEVHVPSKTLKVDHNPSLISAHMILDALRDGDMDALMSVDGALEGRWSTLALDEEDDIEEQVAKIEPQVILSGIFWVVSMLSYIGGNWEYLKYVALLSVAFGLPKIAMKAFRTIRRRQFDANCLMLFAVLGALALQEFTEAAAVTFLFAISEWLERLSTTRARNALSAIVKLRPERANLMDPASNKCVIVPAAAVPVGSIVSVRTGDKIPCDGTVTEGFSAVDESTLTGESRPVKKGPGDSVSGGTINTGVAQLLVKTSSTVDDSAVSRLIKLVEEAQANRSPTEMMIDAFAKRYTPVVIIVAILLCTIPWAFGTEVGRKWTMIGLVTIVIACPCALIISTPVTYVAGLAATAQRGVLVKGGAHLEALGRVKKVAFDKTGTLTEGKFALLHLNVISKNRTRTDVLKHLALIETHSNHPIGTSLVAAAKNENVAIPNDVAVKDLTSLEGEGITAVVNGATVYVGNIRLMDRLGLFLGLPDSERSIVQKWVDLGGTVGFMAIEGEGIVCSYCVADAVRSEARDVVVALEELGIEVNMLTGDNRNAAIAIGKQVGLSGDRVKSQLLPKEKLDFISSMKVEEDTHNCTACQRQGLVLMCGDGVNDAPALAIADVGMAMGSGAALAMETADVTLLDSNLTKMLKSVKLGRRTIRTIKENVIFSLAAKAIVMGFTFAGYTTLWAAIASDVGAMLIVTLNGMKLLPTKRKLRREELEMQHSEGPA